MVQFALFSIKIDDHAEKYRELSNTEACYHSENFVIIILPPNENIVANHLNKALLKVF